MNSKTLIIFPIQIHVLKGKEAKKHQERYSYKAYYKSNTHDFYACRVDGIMKHQEPDVIYKAVQTK